MYKITKEFLQKLKACKDQVEVFNSLFPDGAEVTEENCKYAAENDINFSWAINNILNENTNIFKELDAIDNIWETQQQIVIDKTLGYSKEIWEEYVDKVRDINLDLGRGKISKEEAEEMKADFISSFRIAFNKMHVEYTNLMVPVDIEDNCRKAKLFCIEFNKQFKE